jgi:hypothetical protein
MSFLSVVVRSDVAAPGEPAQRSYESDVKHGVGDLLAPEGFEVRQKVELAAVIGAVVLAAQRHDTVRLIAAAERARDQVGGVDASQPAAHHARLPGDLLALSG